MPRKKQPPTGPATAKQILSFFDQEDYGKASFAFELVTDIMAQRKLEEAGVGTGAPSVAGDATKRPRQKRKKAGLPAAPEADATYGEDVKG